MSDFLEIILKSVYDGIVIIDQKGEIVLFNKSAERLFGYLESEILNKSVSILIPDPDSLMHDHYIKDYLRTKEPGVIGIGREVQGLKKDKTKFPFLISVSETKCKGLYYFVGIIHDLTNEKLVKEEHNRNKNSPVAITI